MSESTQLAERPTSVKDYLALPAYRDRFHEVMGKRANQFMAAIVASSQLPGLKDAEPRSVIAAAMVAATLDLPVNPTLGQAHIVAYTEKGVKVAQFQIGYKGLIQLALRSGQYKRLNAGEVNEEVFKGYDLVGEPVLDWEQLDPIKPVAGYFCAFETLNGFTKVVYWSKPKAEAHAKRFSYAYSKGYSTPWKSDFDSMATKTVIKAALSKWGLLSVEMQKAVVHDQGAQVDVDADVKYVDNDDTSAADSAPEQRAPAPTRSTKGARAARENAAKPIDAVPGDPAPTEATSEQTGVTTHKTGEPVPSIIKAAFPADAAALEAGKPLPPVQNAAPITTLKEHQILHAIVEVVSVKGVRIGSAKDGYTPCARATVKGEFNGEVTHMTAGTWDEKANDCAPNPPWIAGARLKLELVGTKMMSGAIQARVSSADVVQAEGGEIAAE